MGILDKVKDVFSIFDEEEVYEDKEVAVKDNKSGVNNLPKTTPPPVIKNINNSYDTNDNYYRNSNINNNLATVNFNTTANSASKDYFNNSVVKPKITNVVEELSDEKILSSNISSTNNDSFELPSNSNNTKNINSVNISKKVEEKSEESVNFNNLATVNLDYSSSVINNEPKVDVTKPLSLDDTNFNNTLTGKTYYEEERRFKPSQVISPVYGILDKNYKKEDIKVKDERLYEVPRRKNLNYEDIRKKAYGTLTDELERNLYEENLKIKNTINNLDYLLNNLNNANEKKTQDTIDALNNLEQTTQLELASNGQIEVNDIFDITIPNIQIRNIEIDEDKFDKTLIDVPLSVDLTNKLVDLEENLKANNVKVIDHNNNDVINIKRTKNDLYDLISNMYKEGEGS